MVKIWIAFAVVLVSTSSLLAQAAPKTTTPAARSTTAARRNAAKPSLLKPASLNAIAPAVYKAKFTTTKGDFVIEVTRAWAPLGADRFYNLVKNGFYTDAAFFRVLPGFVAQVGIPARPEVARVWSAARIGDDPVSQSNLRGTVSFATAGPNTRTSQIFINYGDNTALDGMGFAPFGKVIEGIELVDQFFAGYGEGAPRGNGPDQGRLTNEGKAYLDKNFPKLDTIKAAVIIGEAPPAAPVHARPKPKTAASAAMPVAAKTTPANKEKK